MVQRHLTVTGFSGVDLVGQAGLEAEYDSQLRGVTGIQTVAVNAAGDVTGTVSQVPSKPGDDLVTSINANVQAVVAQNALSAARITRAKASGNEVNQGAADIVETTDGRIVAMASYPQYNPNVWTNGISEQEFKNLFGNSSDGEPVLNYDTQGEYPPGSTFKVVSTAGAVANGYSINGASYKPARRPTPSTGTPTLTTASLALARCRSPRP